MRKRFEDCSLAGNDTSHLEKRSFQSKPRTLCHLVVMNGMKTPALTCVVVIHVGSEVNYLITKLLDRKGNKRANS